MDTRAVRDHFRSSYGWLPVHAVSVPGRVLLLGQEAAWQEGLGMAVAVDRRVSLAGAPRADGWIEWVWAAAPGRRERFRVNALEAGAGVPWLESAKAVLRELRRQRVHFSGFNAVVHSTIPPGPALGPGAAQAVGVALLVRQLFPFTLAEGGADPPPRKDAQGHLPPLSPKEKLRIARLCQHALAGDPVVALHPIDPFPSLLGKAWHVLSIDCRHQTVEVAPLVGETLVYCEAGSGDESGSAEADRAALLRQFGEAARALMARTLRSVELPLLKANRHRLTPRQYDLAYHLVGDTQRVVFAERALREEDHRQFGHYLSMSDESARDLVRGREEPADRLVRLARGLPGCLGARSLGDGARGATIHLVAYHAVIPFMEALAAGFEAQTGRRVRPAVLQMVDGGG